MKHIVVLGSTGSIGTQTLDVVRCQEDMEICALAAGSNIVRLEEQIREFHPKKVAVWEEEKARELYELLKRRGIQASYIDRDTSVFERGLTVTTFYLAKGLEFDQVFGVFEEEENPLMTQAKYICATRALHELYMYTVSL